MPQTPPVPLRHCVRVCRLRRGITKPWGASPGVWIGSEWPLEAVGCWNAWALSLFCQPSRPPVLAASLAELPFSSLSQALFNLLVPDHAADAFSPPRLSEAGLCDGILERLLGGLSRWDAEHFLFIAEHGYVYEHNWAFFPLFPLSLRTVAGTVLWPLQGLLSLRSRLLLSAALLNTLFSVLASGVLYELSRAVLRCRRRAFLAALLFCLTPANVFMAAAYSESMFALLVFGALWQLEKGRCWTSGLLFSAATGVRSNGLINSGFLLYSQTKCFVARLQAEAGTGAKPRHIARHSLNLVASMLATSTSVFLPFALFQFCAYLRFCSPRSNPAPVVPEPLLQLATQKGYHVAASQAVAPPWCSWDFPVVYSYIQDAYWNVGFLRYFTLRQTPNFLLAAPVIILSSWAAWCYLCANPWHCLTLGLVRRKTAGAKGEASGKPVEGFCSPDAFVYVVHATALLLFGTFCMHVQVSLAERAGMGWQLEGILRGEEALPCFESAHSGSCPVPQSRTRLPRAASRFRQGKPWLVSEHAASRV